MDYGRWKKLSRARFVTSYPLAEPSPAEEIYGKVDSVSETHGCLVSTYNKAITAFQATWGRIPSEIAKEEKEKRCIALPVEIPSFSVFPRGRKGERFMGFGWWSALVLVVLLLLLSQLGTLHLVLSKSFSTG